MMNSEKENLKALVFDLFYNRYFGLIVYVRVFEGELIKKQKIKLCSNLQKIYQVERIGVKTPKEVLKDKLIEGEIGWFTANIRSSKEINIGDTVLDVKKTASPFNFYEKIKPNVYSNIYPRNNFEYKKLKNALTSLQIQDNSLSLENIDSELLGPGFCCGFIGILHQEIIIERLEKEYSCEIFNTYPSVTYRLTTFDNKIIETKNPQKIPPNNKIKSFEELFIYLKITTPLEYLGNISQLCQEKRAIYQNQELKTESISQLIYHLPFSEFITDFNERLKSFSHGYSSIDYQIIGFFISDIVKADILLNNQVIADFSFLAHRTSVYEKARKVCKQIGEKIKRENFSVIIQARVGSKIIVRETLSPFKKNVTGKLYGGDRTRKMKLWAKQKAGKKRMGERGKVNIKANDIRAILQQGNKN